MPTLNSKRIAKLGAGRYRDPDSRGLYLQVGPTGTKSWIFRFQLNKRPERAMGLGAYPDFSLKEARERARAARQLLTDGIDPIEAKAIARDAKRAEAISNVTFRQAAKAYIAAHADGWKNAKHRQQWQNTLEQYAFPQLGERLVANIDSAVINDAIAPIWQRIPDSAARTKGRIERVIQWVKDGRPLPKPPAAKLVRHHPAVPYRDIPAFFAQLRTREGVAPLALQFLILTAARTSEVIGATWDEVNFEDAVWTVPAARMKAGKPHTVPLTADAIDLLRSLPREEGNAHLFIGGRRGKPLSNMAMLTLMRRMHPDHVPHGLRSSFRDWAGDCTNFPRDVAEAALAHALKDRTEAAYRRGSALEKRRKLMETWAQYCTSPQPAGDVVRMRSVR